jgi:hypothetical protein
MLTHRTCSNCNNWSLHKSQLDGVMVADCHVQIIRKSLEASLFKVTKGSDTCGQWEKSLSEEYYENFIKIVY